MDEKIWTTLIMHALTRASLYNMDIRVNGNRFFVTDNSTLQKYFFPLKYVAGEHTLYDLENCLEEHERKLNKTKIENIRKQALNKLTKEEKEVLGLF